MSPKAKKSYGQHFLIDRSVIRKSVQAAEIKPGETVLEIGPGTGALTSALVETGARVVAVEADRDLIPALETRFGDAIELIQGDALKVPLEGLVGDFSYKIVANLPYNISSAFLERYLRERPRATRLVLMLQRELADRALAKPPAMSVLSVAAQLYASGRKVCNVPPSSFRPRPRVDSSVIVLDRLRNLETDPEPAIRLAKAGFASRRKQLHGNLAAAGIAPSERVKELLVAMGREPTARAQELMPEDWVRLERELRKK